MELFVNRKPELQLIDASFQSLLDNDRLLRTPIIEVQGIGGIGKTSLLKQVELRCHTQDLPYIWIDISQNLLSIEQTLIEQVNKYLAVEIVETSPLEAMKILLAQGPVAMLLDEVDTASEEQLKTIEMLLRDLVDNERFFVVLTTKKILPFRQERTVARKLTTLLLKALDRKNCEYYLNNQSPHINTEIRNIIFEWTRGYPLAMNCMTEAINGGLDPRQELDRAQILAQLSEQVINAGVLAHTQPESRARYYASLQLLSVPRRFNLVIMQDLIEKFAPELRRESSMAYFGLPKEINDATNVLNWSMTRAGFSVDEPLRNIFLLLLKNAESEHYFEIHSFLADVNLKLAHEFPGSDRVRYIRECLYHTASDSATDLLPKRLQQPMELILSEPLNTFQQFSEEFSQDDELKETLGSYLTTIQKTIDEHFKDSR